MSLYHWLQEDLLVLHPDLHVRKSLVADLFAQSLQDFYRAATSRGLMLVLKSAGFDTLYGEVAFCTSEPHVQVTWYAGAQRLNVRLALDCAHSYALFYQEFCFHVEDHLRALLAPRLTNSVANSFFRLAAQLEGTGAQRDNWQAVRRAYADYLQDLVERAAVPLADISQAEALLITERRLEGDITERNLVIEPAVSQRKD